MKYFDELSLETEAILWWANTGHSLYGKMCDLNEEELQDIADNVYIVALLYVIQQSGNIELIEYSYDYPDEINKDYELSIVCKYSVDKFDGDLNKAFLYEDLNNEYNGTFGTLFDKDVNRKQINKIINSIDYDILLDEAFDDLPVTFFENIAIVKI